MQEKQNSSDAQIYELGFHIVPSVAENDLPEIISKLKTIITENSAVVISEGFPQLKQLAYPIQKENSEGKKSWVKAYFGWVKFEVAKESIKKIEQVLKNDSQILRFLLVKTVKENTIYYSKSSLDVSKEARDDEVKPAIKEVSQEEIDKSIEELVIN